MEGTLSMSAGNFRTRASLVCKPASPNIPIHCPPPASVHKDHFDDPYERPASVQERYFGLHFIWSDGSNVDAGTACSIKLDNGKEIQDLLDDRGMLYRVVPSSTYEVQLLPQSTPDAAVASARASLQVALDGILEDERAEAAKLKAVQDGRSTVVNTLYLQWARLRGSGNGLLGLLEFLKEGSDLVNVFVHLSNAWTAARAAEGGSALAWIESYARKLQEEHKRELIDVLGFDPSAVTLDGIAHAFEIICFIWEDAPSKNMLGKFAEDYVMAQNPEELAEFIGAIEFEIALTALLIAFTGGVGRLAMEHASFCFSPPLGDALNRLGIALRARRLKVFGHWKGKTGGSVETVKVPRPPEARTGAPTVVSRKFPILRNAHRAVIDPQKIIGYALNKDHPVGGNKARVFESSLGFTQKNADQLLDQIRKGVLTNDAIPGKIDEYGTRFTVDIMVKGPAGSSLVRTGWIYAPGAELPKLTTLFVK